MKYKCLTFFIISLSSQAVFASSGDYIKGFSNPHVQRHVIAYVKDQCGAPIQEEYPQEVKNKYKACKYKATMEVLEKRFPAIHDGVKKNMSHKPKQNSVESD
jgi:hypothetical protein